MALKRIVLRDFVIVSALELELDSGFTVLTGETGAGKSILIDAVQFATGARADSAVVREGASRAEASVEFDVSPAVSSLLEEAGFDAGTSVLLRRTVDLAGKSRAWINGSPATAQQLRAVGEQLLDIHGQHAWQSLTRADAVRDLLDAYAQVSHAEILAAWALWREVHARLAQAQTGQETRLRERERLSWQIGELERLAPQDNEWEELNSRQLRLSNAQALLDGAQSAVQLLADDEANVLQRVHSALQQLRALQHLELDFKDPADGLDSALVQMEDVARTLRAYLRRTDFDTSGLGELDERLAQWLALARRHRREPQELPAVLQSWKAELAELEGAMDLDALQASEHQAHTAYLQQAQVLRQARAKAAPLLGQAITQAMQGLGMQGGKFEVELVPSGQPTSTGLDEVRFLVAGHAGNTPRPVGKVASGGELSRLALAIAVTTSRLGTAQSLIFDEVDSGVGGAVAETVGRLMQQLGKDRQVLAVTHLPQVAACADHHLVVSKHSDGQTTLSTISKARGEQRLHEIARMLGGDKRTGTTLAHAQEMLQSGN